MSSETSMDFVRAFRGSFVGILRWPQLDELWQVIKADQSVQWYVYAVGEQPPQSPVAHSALEHFLDEINSLLRREHDHDYCGVVYVDNREAPGYVKIFDPNNLGVSCGYSDNPPLPGWILSTIKPADLPNALPPPGGRKRWWQKIFSA